LNALFGPTNINSTQPETLTKRASAPLIISIVMRTQQLETAIVVYLHIDEDHVDGSYINRPSRGSSHLSFVNFSGSLRLSYMAQIGDAVFPTCLPQSSEVVDAVFPAGLPQLTEVIDTVGVASLPSLPKKVIDLTTPQAPRTRYHDPLVSTSRGSIHVKPNGEDEKIKIEGMNKRKRSDNMQETKVNHEQCNSPPREIRVNVRTGAGGNRKLG
jgi:D-ribose pyranose/furanose isomerase RbsD